jgi:Flp pilus assembly protein TadD
VIALWLDPADAGTLASLGRLHLTSGRYSEAVDTLTRAASLDPADAQIVHALGEALMRVGDANAGRQHIDTAVRLQERAVDAQRRARTAGMLSLQAELELSQANAGGAIELLRNAATLESRDVSIRMRLADALVAANRLEEAAAELQQAVSLNAGPDVHRRLANVYSALGRSEDRARELQLHTNARLQELRERAGEAR